MRVAVLAGVLVVVGCFSENPVGSSADGDDTSSTASTTEAATEHGDPSTETVDPLDDTASDACAPGWVCAPPVPDGWTGPASLRVAPVGPAPGCAGGYPDAIWTLGAEIEATGACACSCGTAPNVGCAAPVEILEFDDGTCGGQPQQVTAQAQGICVAFDPSHADMRLRIPPSGTCPVVQTPRFTDAAFGLSVAACGGAAQGESCAAGSCVPQPQPPYDDGLCVWQQGEHECPADWTEAHVGYNAIDDRRDCEGLCTCELEAFSCPGYVYVDDSTGLTCSGTLAYSNLGSCIATGSVTTLRAAFDPTAPHVLGDCVAAADSVEPNDMAVGTSPVTFCCR
jgi:hypothetical protein